MFTTDDISLLRQEFGNRLRMCSPYHMKVDKHNLWTGKNGTCFQLEGTGRVETGKISTFVRKVKGYNYVESDQGQLEIAMKLLDDVQLTNNNLAFTDASIKNNRIRIAAVVLFKDGSIVIESKIIEKVDINAAEQRSIELAIQIFSRAGVSGSDFVIYNDNKTAVRAMNVDNVLWKSRTQTKIAHKGASM